jgi:hypothetical protein
MARCGAEGGESVDRQWSVGLRQSAPTGSGKPRLVPAGPRAPDRLLTLAFFQGLGRQG